MKNDQITVTRGNIGQWASFVGAAGLLFGILGIIWQGGFTNYVVAILAIGVGGVALWALMTPQEFKAFVSGRQVRYSTSAVFSTLLLLGIVVLVYIVLQRSQIVADMTIDERFSLSAETKSILDHVHRPIQITGFYSSRNLPSQQVDDQFFRLYETASNGLVHLVYINPDEQPAVAQKYGVQNDGDVFIAFLNPDNTVDFSTLARIPRSTRQERDVTEAISRLLLSGQFMVYFETSHDELSIGDNSAQGISGIHNGIQESGLITNSLDLKQIAANGGKIPADASAVILARPTTDFSAQEIAVLDEYLKRGGGLFIMADVLFNQDAFMAEKGAFNQYLWNNFGIRALDAAVVDPGASGQTPLDVVSAVVFPDTDIGARLDPQQPAGRTTFRLARALEVNNNPPVNNGRVIMSSQNSYGETDLKSLSETNTYHYDKDQDLPGPLTTVAWAWNKTTNGKVLLVGDSDFITNGQVVSQQGDVTVQGNAILFTDGLGWLTGFSQKVNFTPKAITATPLLNVDGQTLDWIAFLTVVLMPGLVLAMGIAVWWRRARR